MQGTVLVVDDDPSILKAYDRLLIAAGYETQLFSTGAEILRLDFSRVAARGVSCILLDLRLGGVSGLEIHRALPPEHPPVVFISGRGDIPSAVDAFKSGALNFLEKPVDELELIAAVENALAVDAATRERIAMREDAKTRCATLSPREGEVLRQVLTGRFNKVIASELDISEKTVKVHRARVYQKMGVRSVAELSRLCVIAGVAPANESTADGSIQFSSYQATGTVN